MSKLKDNFGQPEKGSTPLEPSSPLTTGELQAIAHRQVIRNWLALAAVSIATVALVAFVVISLFLLGNSNKQQALSDRSDCKTNYQSVLQGPVTQRDNLEAQVSDLNGNLQSQLGFALIQGQSGNKPTQAQVTAFVSTESQLNAKITQLEGAIAKVKTLPTLSRATMHGFTLDGKHYPACPTA
jgi:TolA-binding protein